MAEMALNRLRSRFASNHCKFSPALKADHHEAHVVQIADVQSQLAIPMQRQSDYTVSREIPTPVNRRPGWLYAIGISLRWVRRADAGVLWPEASCSGPISIPFREDPAVLLHYRAIWSKIVQF